MNLVQMLKESAARFGEKAAVIHGEHHLSFNALNAASNQLAAALQNSGMRKGDRIALLLGNSLEFVVAYFGIVKTGAVAVLLDPKYKPAELLSLLGDCRPRAVIAETAVLDSLAQFKSELSYIELMLDTSPAPQETYRSLSNFMAACVAEFTPIVLADPDLAHISYTSGPSFAPRGVMAPHGNLAEEIRISAQSFEQSEHDVVIQFALPMHHVIGLTVVMLTSLYCGSSLIILNGISIDSLTYSIERHHVTMFMGVPFIHALLLRKVREEGLKNDLSSLRVCASAGDILPFEIVEDYRRLLNLRLINFYGLTETLGHVTCEPLHGTSKKSSVGPALPGWKIRIVDTNGGDIPATQAGEVIISGPMMAGYYHKPQVNADIIKDGWLHTGDRGMLDADGYLYMLGLQKDMLICKGQNIFPSDIEHVSLQHPAVERVAAVGVPDKMRGEVAGVAIVFKKGAHASETSLLKFCLERLANYKVPKYFVFWDALPETKGGLVDKAKIRDYFIKQSPSKED